LQRDYDRKSLKWTYTFRVFSCHISSMFIDMVPMYYVQLDTECINQLVSTIESLPAPSTLPVQRLSGHLAYYKADLRPPSALPCLYSLVRKMKIWRPESSDVPHIWTSAHLFGGHLIIGPFYSISTVPYRYYTVYPVLLV
jgi:hypothetical protein